jgi:chromosome partitioning protein
LICVRCGKASKYSLSTAKPVQSELFQEPPNMAVIAIYNIKGGVGKTSLAVNLGWCSATHSARRTLLWDLDPQGGAGYLLGETSNKRARAHAVFAREIDAKTLVRPTAFAGLDLLPADVSLRSLDVLLLGLGKKRRLAKLTGELSKEYDRIILDCPPILNEVSDQFVRAADLIIVPCIPSPLAQHSLAMLMQHLAFNHKGHSPVLPVLSMVDRRRTLHRVALLEHSDWPVIPMSSIVDQAGTVKKPVGAFAPNSLPSKSFSDLWKGVERKLASLS